MKKMHGFCIAVSAVVLAFLVLGLVDGVLYRLCYPKRKGSPYITPNKAERPTYEQIQSDPEAIRRAAVQFGSKKTFYTDGSLTFTATLADGREISAAPFGEPSRASVEVLPFRAGHSFRYNELARAQSLKYSMAHPLILPVIEDGRLVAQWAYDSKRKIFSGRTLPAGSSVPLGFLGGNGFVDSRNEARPLGDFYRCQLSRPDRDYPESSLWVWQTQDAVYLIDPVRRKIVFTKPWQEDLLDAWFAYPSLSRGRSKGAASQAVCLRLRSGEWVLFAQNADGTSSLIEGTMPADIKGLHIPGFAGDDIYLLQFGTDGFEAASCDTSGQNKTKRWVALYRLDENSFSPVKRHEWSRDFHPAVPRTVRRMTKLYDFLGRGIQPLAGVVHRHFSKDLKSDPRLHASGWKQVRLNDLSVEYTHWQLFWTAVALGGFFLYQRKRKLERTSVIIWAVLTFALGPLCLLACWVVKRRKKGTGPPEKDPMPQQLLIAE